MIRLHWVHVIVGAFCLEIEKWNHDGDHDNHVIIEV